MAESSFAARWERLEAFCDGKILELDNFRKIVAHGWKGIKHYKSRTQAKGHNEEIVAVVKAIGEGRDAPIPLEQILESSRVTLDLATQNQ
mgnify:CR=1 FL=1